MKNLRFLLPILLTLAQFARAAQFDGTARIDVSDPTGALSWNTSTNAMTIECWFKLSIPSTATLSKNLVILSNIRDATSPSGNYAYLIQFNIYTGNIEFTAKGGSGTLPAQTMISRPFLERWYHVAVTRNNTVFSFFVDGRRTIPDLNQDIGSTNNSNGLYIGGTPDDGSNLYGEVQEVAYYQTPLLQGTIIDYMFKDQPFLIQSALKGYYQLNSDPLTKLTNRAQLPPSGSEMAVASSAKVTFDEASISGEQSTFDTHKNGGRDSLAPLSGSFPWQHTLFKRGTTGIPLEFKIGYNSAQAHNGTVIPQFPAFDSNGLSPGWTHNFDTRVVPSDAFQPAGTVSSLGLLLWDGTMEVWDYDEPSSRFKTRHGEYRGEITFSGFLPSVNAKLIWTTPERLQYVFNNPYAGDSTQRGRLVQIRDFNATPNHIDLEWDSFGFLQTVTDTAGGVLRFQYASAKLTQVGYLGPDLANPLWKVAFTHNAQNRLATFALTGPAEHASNPVIPTTWGFFYKTATDNTNGLLEKIADPRGYNGGTPSYHDITIAYDKYARVISTTDGIGRVQKTQYNVPTKRQISRTDAYQSTQATPKNTVETFDRKSRVLSRKDQLGNTNSFEYNDDKTKGPIGTITATVDANGTRIEFLYDARGNALKQTIVPLGQVKQWDYTASVGSGANAFPLNKPTKQIDPPALHDGSLLPASWVTNFEYDSAGNLKRQFDALGDTQRINFDARGQLLDSTDANGYTTSFTYTVEGFVQTKVVPGTLPAASRTWTYTYTDLGWPKTETNPLSQTTQMFQDINGNTNKVIDAAQRTFLKTFDANGNLLADADAKGQQTLYTYDNADQKLTMQQRDHTVGAPRIWTYEYTLRGEPWRVRDPSLSAPNYTVIKDYDDAGRLLKETDALGFFSSVQYDAVGNIRFATDKESKVSETRYDALNRVIFQQDPEGNATRTAYDNVGRVDTITTPRSTVMKHSYDGRSRLKKWTDAESFTWLYTYDANSNILDIEDAMHGHYIMTYGPRNERLSELNQDGKTWSYTYDELLRLKTQTDPSNITRTVLYDEVSRVDTVTFSTGRSTSFFYDVNSNPLEIRRTDINGVIKTKPLYDSMDRVTSISDTLTNKIVGYTYDAASRVKTTVYPGGQTLIRTYDNAGRLLTLTDWAASPRNSHFTYDKMGRLLTHTYPNGITTTYAFDKSGRITTLAHGTQIALGYAYDRNGNKLSETKKGALDWQPGNGPGQVPEIDETFTVKPDGKLISSTDTKNAARNTSFAFSDSGNMLTSTSTAVSTSFTYDEDNRATTLTYTPQAPLALHQVTNRYDALGRRLARTLTVNGTTTQTLYVLDLLGDMERILCDATSTGTITARYVHGPDGLGYKEDATTNQITCYHADAMGNVIRLTDGSGNSTADYAYSPYGQVLASTGTAAAANPYRFVGSQGVMEEFPGIYFMRARYYSTDTMRFLSVDPVKNIGPGWKPEAYAYANGNPMTFSDAAGLYSRQDFVKDVTYGGAWVAERVVFGLPELLARNADNMSSIAAGTISLEQFEHQHARVMVDGATEAVSMMVGRPGLGSQTKIFLAGQMSSLVGDLAFEGEIDKDDYKLGAVVKSTVKHTTNTFKNVLIGAGNSLKEMKSSMGGGSPSVGNAASYASSTNSSQSKLAPVSSASVGSSGGGGSSYIIRPGDTLSTIAARNNTTVAALMAANKSITNANVIIAGTSLTISGGSGGGGSKGGTTSTPAKAPPSTSKSSGKK